MNQYICGPLGINIAAVLIAGILSDELTDNEISLLASFLYTIADALNTTVLSGNITED